MFLGFFFLAQQSNSHILTYFWPYVSCTSVTLESTHLMSNFVTWQDQILFLFCTSSLKAIQTKNEKKGLLSSATFQVIFHTVQFICYDLANDIWPIILLSLCWSWEFMSPWNFFKSYGNQIFVRQIVTNHTFMFYLVLPT